MFVDCVLTSWEDDVPAQVRDRLWKRQIREGVTKPFISEEEVEREMVLLPRESKTPKSGTLNAEVISKPSIPSHSVGRVS